MTGGELRTKAINGARGVVSWGKLSAAEKGMWNNAVREIQHEKDKLLAQVVLSERKAIIWYIREGGHSYLCDGGLLDNIEDGHHLL